ncbi:MAG: thioredoxin family protein [Synergistaceae bacterium]|jgi:thioredoxin 1|nr:thioredoxin family protein [Synergistaceae bacterium]
MNILLCVLPLLALFPTRAHAAGLPSLKMLSTPNCSACAQMSHVLDALNEKYAGRLTAEKINVMENREMAVKYKIRYVPHLLFLDAEGTVVKEKVGALPLEEVLNTFREAGVNIG